MGVEQKYTIKGFQIIDILIIRIFDNGIFQSMDRFLDQIVIEVSYNVFSDSCDIIYCVLTLILTHTKSNLKVEAYIFSL